MCGAHGGRRGHAYPHRLQEALHVVPPPPPPHRPPCPPPPPRRRTARSLAGALAVCSVAAPVATAVPINAGLHLRGHGAAQAIRTQAAARSFVLADRATPQAAPSTSRVLADRVSS